MKQVLPILVSRDWSTVLMHYTLTGTSQEATANVEEIIHVVAEANETDDFLVLVGGEASVAFETTELAEADLLRGERFGVPVALVVLLVLFGALVATSLPLSMAAVSIIVALAAVEVIGQQFQLVIFVTMMVVMLGLAVGIDYSLLIVSRFNEEMRHGLSTKDAVAKTGGPRVDFLTIRFLDRFSLKGADTSQGGFWDSITHLVTRRPVVSLIIIGVPMMALSLLYLDIRTGLNDVNTFPDKAETKKAFLLMEEKFSFGTPSSCSRPSLQ